MAAMPAIRPIVDQANVESSRPRSVSPRNRLSRWPLSSSAVACSSAIVASSAPDSWASVTAALASRSGPPEVGVGGAAGDVGEVPVDEAGVGLGLGAGGDLFAGVLDEVGAALLLERRLVGEEDVLGGQLVADVVLGEVAAPGQQGAGDDEDGGDDDAGDDEQAVDGAPADDDRVVDRGRGHGGRGAVRLGLGQSGARSGCQSLVPLFGLVVSVSSMRLAVTRRAPAGRR